MRIISLCASVAFALVLASVGSLSSTRTGRAQCTSALVYPGTDGLLVYVPDAQGNRIPDFSNVGYQGGGVDPPEVPVRAIVEPGPGDAGARIQTAINVVSQLPLDASGFRGAVLVRRGEYPIAGHVEIRTSGVVLRGEGQSEGTGTVLRATGTGRRALVQVAGAGSRQKVPGTEHLIIDDYVPVGATSFNVDSTGGLAVGNTVVVHRPSPAQWIRDIGMHLLANPWQPGSKNIEWERVITSIDGNLITVDAPITTALEARYEGGTIYRYTWPGRIGNVGVEKMKGRSDFISPTDEEHAWDFISLATVEQAWVREITAQYFAYSLVNVRKSARSITVADSVSLDPVSQITGGRRYSFNIDGQLVLVRDSRARDGRHDFVLGSVVAGPNVFVGGVAERAHSDTGPHHRWSSGSLFDNIFVQGNDINIRNRGNSGTGHGWAGANTVVWNSAARRMIIQKPPTAQNWSIGNIAESQSGDGHWEAFGCPVDPPSLYYAQLIERLARDGRLFLPPRMPGPVVPLQPGA